jgi:hypothetical protein
MVVKKTYVYGAAASVTIGLVTIAAGGQTGRGEPAPGVGSRPPGSTAREVDLRPRFELGRVTRYRFELRSENKLIAPNTPEIDGDQKMVQIITLVLKPTAVSDDGATVELVYESIKASLETADFLATFDSAGGGSGGGGTGRGVAPKRSPQSPAGKPGSGAATADPEMSDLLAQIMRPMVGATLTLQVDPAGNIRSVSGGAALAGGGGVLGALGGLGGLGGVAMPASGGAASPMNWLITGPAQRGKVRVGESWTNNDSLAGTPIGGFQMVTRHTCRSANQNTAECSFSGRADQASSGAGGAGGAAAPGLGAFTLKEAAYSGNYSWDLRRGELSELSSTLRSEVMQGAGGESDTRMSAETRITVKRLN